MIAVKCSACGANVPVALASPDRIACPFCGHEAAPEPELARRLEAAAATLAGIDRQARQLSGAQRRSIRASGAWILAYALLLFALAAPFLLAAAIAILVLLVFDGRFNPALTAVLCAPLLVVSIAALRGMVALTRRRRALFAACAATPPARPGEPAFCHVCAGPVELRGRIVRCAYCDADNLVDPSVMRRFGQRDAAALGELQQHVEAQAHALSRTGAWASVSALLLVFTAPVLALCWMFAASAGLRWLKLPADTSIRYGLEDGCFVEHGGDIGVESLPGRHLQYRFAYDVAVVERVYRDPIFDTNHIEARAGDELRREAVQGLCLAADASMWLAHDQRYQRDWLHFDGEWVWFLVGAKKQGGALRRVSIEGGPVQELMRVEDNPLDAAVDVAGRPWLATWNAVYNSEGKPVVHGTISGIEAGPAGVYACGKDQEGPAVWQVDGSPRLVARPLTDPVHCVLDGSTLYLQERLGFGKDREWGLGTLVSVDLDSGQRTVLADSERPGDHRELHVYDGWLYWIEKEGMVKRVRAGSRVEQVDLGAYSKKDLLLQGDRWFWITGAGVHTRPVAGEGAAGLLLPPATSPNRLAGDEHWIVWNEPMLDGRITRRSRAGITVR
jgi:hypothetical protein